MWYDDWYWYTIWYIFLDSFTDNDILNTINVWDNTIIVLTGDNGGSLDKGSCNYPLRGGKNTFHEGGQRVLAIVGGGYIPEKQKGVVFEGLVSKVHWAPAFLSFANLLSTDYTHVTLGESSNGGSNLGNLGDLGNLGGLNNNGNNMGLNGNGMPGAGAPNANLGNLGNVGGLNNNGNGIPGAGTPAANIDGNGLPDAGAPNANLSGGRQGQGVPPPPPQHQQQQQQQQQQQGRGY